MILQLARRCLASTLAIVLGVAALSVASAETDTRPTLIVDPAVVELGPGERRMVAVRVSGIPAEGLSAFQLELKFDPQSIGVRDPNAAFVTQGVPSFAPLGGSPLCEVIRETWSCPDPDWMLAVTGRETFGTSSIENSTGTVTIAFGTAGDSDPVVGRGTLALIEVIGKKRSRSALVIRDAILADGSRPVSKYAYSISTPGAVRTTEQRAEPNGVETPNPARGNR